MEKCSPRSARAWKVNIKKICDWHHKSLQLSTEERCEGDGEDGENSHSGGRGAIFADFPHRLDAQTSSTQQIPDRLHLLRKERQLEFVKLKKSRATTTYIAWQHVRLSREHDSEYLALGQCLAERQHEVISDSFHHLHGPGELIVGQVEHCA